MQLLYIKDKIEFSVFFSRNQKKLYNMSHKKAAHLALHTRESRGHVSGTWPTLLMGDADPIFFVFFFKVAKYHKASIGL